MSILGGKGQGYSRAKTRGILGLGPGPGLF